MATKQKRAQGGGRTPNSEPRLQVFRDFAGCNFQLSPRDFTLGDSTDFDEQSDLQMNYVVIQNNASIADNKTIETRNQLVKLFEPGEGLGKFTGVAALIAGRLFMATSDNRILYDELANAGGVMNNQATFFYPSSQNNEHEYGYPWTALDYYDDKVIAASGDRRLWYGSPDNVVEISTVSKIDDTAPLTMANLTAMGTLSISSGFTQSCPFRTDIAWTIVNRFGPTKITRSSDSDNNVFTFYSSVPVDEWHSGCYLRISGSVPTAAITNGGAEAVELYYSADNASELLFMGRVDLTPSNNNWSYNWLGYLDATNMWPMANLLYPTENYTEGAPVTRMTNIDGRMYFWGDDKTPYRLYIGGNPGNLFSVSPGTGGGFVDIEPGSGQEVRFVDKYKTQSGNSIVTILCDSPNSMNEQRFNLVENTISISNESGMNSWNAEQVAGSVGCKSYYGAEVCEDGLYSVSRYGLALTTMTMEYNSQIRANYVSNQIKPVFTDTVDLGQRLKNAVLIELDGILYLCFGKDSDKPGELDNIIFCYDIDLKSWWTYTIDVDEPILNMIHIDYEGYREGIGIITGDAVYLLPTTMNDSPEDTDREVGYKIETGELSAQIPQQQWVYLSQMEFRFDYFIGDMTIQLIGIDQFGRRVNTKKVIRHDDTAYDLAEYMRVDLRLQSYKIIMEGTARFRLTHFISKVYTLSNKVGLVWGFDDSQSHRPGKTGDIHPTFKSYNDIRKAIIP